MPDAFTPWRIWSNPLDLLGLPLPGVYAIAVSESDISGEPFGWREEITYIGMTNSKGGLRQRLRQFDRTIHGGEGHGGARRFRFKYRDPHALEARLFVAIRPFQCDVSSNRVEDLRIMGAVAAFEYECLANYVGLHGRLPEFNDKARSPKD